MGAFRIFATARPARVLASRCLVLAYLLLLGCLPPAAQSGPARRLITQQVDEANLTLLEGNTHPLARAEFDRGAAEPAMPIQHMQLLLRRTAEQESALETLLAGQQDKSSPDYRRWLAPDDFGRQFGASDEDVQIITRWLA